MTSVVVPVFNGAHILPRTVPAVLALDGVDEWVWVDDGSTDETAALLDRLLAGHSRARLHRHAANRGRAAARNSGAASTDADILLFIDVDTVPDRDLALACADALADPDAVAAVPRWRLGEPLPPAPYGDYLRRWPRGPHAYAPGAVLPWRYFVTAAAAVRTAAWAASGGFDERIRYGEDLALACALARDRPDGLRLAAASAELHDVKTLPQVLDAVAQWAADLPAVAARFPDVWHVAGLDRLPARHSLGGRVLRAETVRRAAAWGAARLPPAARPWAVRYLLGHRLLTDLDTALDAATRAAPGAPEP